MINFDIKKYGHIFNAAVNILAVECLVKENNDDRYSECIEILRSFDDMDMLYLDVSFSLNMHIQNLGEMITQGDYDEQKEILFNALEEKKETGKYFGD